MVKVTAEAWLRDLEVLGECTEEVAAIMTIADKVLKGGKSQQKNFTFIFQTLIVFVLFSQDC